MTAPPPKPSKQSSTQPAWLTEFQSLYEGNLVHNAGPDQGPSYTGAMEDYADLSDGDQRFVLAHLLALNLRAQAAAYGQRVRLHRELLEAVQGLPEGIVEMMIEVRDSLEPDEDAEPAPLSPQDHEEPAPAPAPAPGRKSPRPRLVTPPTPPDDDAAE